jgi:hypothetical protein
MNKKPFPADQLTDAQHALLKAIPERDHSNVFGDLNGLPAPKDGLRVCPHCSCDTTEHKRFCDYCGEPS